MLSKFFTVDSNLLCACTVAVSIYRLVLCFYSRTKFFAYRFPFFYCCFIFPPPQLIAIRIYDYFFPILIDTVHFFLTLNCCFIRSGNLSASPQNMTLVAEFILIAATVALFRPILEKLSGILDVLNQVSDHQNNTIVNSGVQNSNNSYGSLENNGFIHERMATDIYKPANNVPRNPPRLTLDYNSMSTSEGQLKDAVLDDSRANTVEVIADGMGGVGKTCAMLGLAMEGDVQERFKDGLLFIKLGKDANKITLREGIMNIVELTGGRNLANRLRDMTELGKVVERAAQWFERRSCLFLLDDVWKVNQIDSAALLTLAGLVKGSSRLVYTTRDKGLSIHRERSVAFHCKDWLLSRQMLITHSFNRNIDISDANEEAIHNILTVCAGHPLAIGIAGSSVRKTASRMPKGQEQNALRRIAEEIQSAAPRIKTRRCLGGFRPIISNEKTSLMNMKGLEDPFYGRITLVVDSSLKTLKKEGHQLWDVFFAKLSVLKKQKHQPLGMLQKLWGVIDLSELDRITDMFCNVSIIHITEDETGKYFHVHDLIIDIARHKAGTQTSRYIISMLNRYMLWRPMQHRKWWEFDDDGYIYDNVCKLLAVGGCKQELLWLLQRPQWIVRRLQAGGLSAVENDIREGISFCSQEGRGFGSHMRHLEAISQAAYMSGPFVSDNVREAWFQMHGRLFSYSRNCTWTNLFIEDLERSAPRPWAKCTTGFLDAAGGALRHITRSHDSALQVAMVGQRVTFLTENYLEIHSIDKEEAIFKCVEGGMYFESCCMAFSGDEKLVVSRTGMNTLYLWDIEHGDARASLIGHSDFVQCVAFSGDAKRIISGSDDRTVRVWNAQRGQGLISILHGHKRAVICVASSHDATRVASGSKDKTICVWEVRTGRLVTSPLRGHTDWVRCVCLSADGTRIASGSDDRTVRVWNAETGQLVSSLFNGFSDLVRCVAFNSNATKLVSGSDDRIVRVWDIEGGQTAITPLEGHTGLVLCVAFSADDTRVVSGSDDNSIRVWDMENMPEPFKPPESHTDMVICVAFNKDKTKIVTGSDDKSVRIWDVESGQQSIRPLKGHTGLVICVSFNYDSTLIGSGSDDRTVRVWDLNCADLAIPPLRGHTDMVICVAFNNNGSQVVSGSRDKTVRVWNIKSGQPVHKCLNGHSDLVISVSFSGNGKRIVSGSWDCTVLVWDAESGNVLTNPLVGHTDRIECVTFSGDGTNVVSGSKDKTVRVWSMEGECIFVTPCLHESIIKRVAVDEDARFVVSKDRQGLQRLWNVRYPRCVCTSEDTEWISEIEKLSLTWASGAGLVRKRVLEWPSKTGRVVLATVPFSCFQVDNLLFTETFSAHCRIIE